MYDENAEFSLTWAPPRYPHYSDDERGAWKVLLDDDRPVAVVWVNDANTGAGVLWVSQTDLVENLRRHFKNAYEAGIPARFAYNGSDLLPGVKFAPEQSGPMSDIDYELRSMTEE